ncbi:MAG TPA: hypothetical protein VFH80_25525, partial [Solirubrobacteraceae bacterium]|nr:hypothetical protein [Solirubrobacteraceae bacterium]
MRAGVLVAAGIAPVAALVLFVTVICGAAAGGTQAAVAAAATSTCSRSGPIAGLDSVQAANAHAVIAVAEGVGGRQAAVIAVSVA